VTINEVEANGTRTNQSAGTALARHPGRNDDPNGGIIVSEAYKTPSNIVKPVYSLPKRRSNRRTIAKGMAGAATAAIIVPRITFAQDASPAASPAASADFVPSGMEGVPDVFLKYPTPQKTYDGVPGSGGTVRAFTISYSPPPTPKDDNQYWQELEARLGVTWEIDMTPQPNYGEKSAALLAGGDLPDLFYINPGQNASQQYQALAQGAFLDLTPYVTGDALQQFQNLREFPQFMWDNLKFQGKIFGVPLPSGRGAGQPHYRVDWAETLGESPDTWDGLRAMLAAFTNGDPDGNGSQDTWGQGRFNGGWNVWDNRTTTQATRTPNNWRLNDDGTLVNMIETDEYRQAIELQIAMFQEGAYHPDAASMTFDDAKNTFIAGGTGLHYEGTTSFYGRGSTGGQLADAYPEARITNVPIVAVDGGPGVTHNGGGFFGYVGIPASIGDDERVLELLRILDYLASPFGSEEELFLSNGLEGVHWEYNDAGAPVRNDKGQQDISDLTYLMGPQNVLFYAETPELGLEVQRVLKDTVSVGIDDPTLTLFSQTNVDMGPTLSQLGMDSITPIVTGRESIDALDAAIQSWKDQGGEQIRQEFQEALQSQG
jgi:putative aldouronate transport system substrate-binding protein